MRGLLLTFSVALVIAVACGKTTTSGRDSGPDAGEAGSSGESVGGSRARGGSAGAATGGGNDGGEPSDGGAPTGGTGSNSGGGSSNGGASAGGSGRVSLPDGCEGTELFTGTSCGAEMTCGGRRLNLSCAVAAGLWECRCTEGPSALDFDFPVATGVTACEAALKACADPGILSDDVCERTRTMGVLGCAIHDRCETLHDVDGVTLRTRSAWDASCDDCIDPAAFCCSCENPSVIDYRIRDVNVEAGCDFMEELCRPDNVAPVGEKFCELTSESGNPPTSCEAMTECGQPAELGDGTLLTLAEQRRIECYPKDDRSVCICLNEENQNELAIDLGTASIDPATCRAASAVCSEMEPLESTGPRECTPNTDIVLPDGCTLYVDCVEPATMAGVAVTAFTNVGAQCSLQANGSFLCYCNNRTSGPYELEADDSESACVEALEVCPMLAPTF
jgi:hypothetical protein